MSDSCCPSGCGCDCTNIPDHKMCKLSEPAGGFDLEKVKQLTSNPKFICKCCARTANDRDNLCSPDDLAISD